MKAMFSQSNPLRKKGRPPPFRPQLERLEDRQLLTIETIMLSGPSAHFDSAWTPATSLIHVSGLPQGAEALTVRASLNVTADRVEDLTWYLGRQPSFRHGPRGTGGVTGTRYSTTVDLAVPSGLPASGDWYFEVSDRVPNGHDTGQIDSWTITIQYYYEDLPSIRISDQSMLERNGGTTNAIFNVSLSHASTQTISVQYSTADGSASVSDDDYEPASGLLTFPPGTTSLPIIVGVKGDSKEEPNETFFVNLSGETNATVARRQATGTITDDDSIPSVSINDMSTTEGDTGTRIVTFTVTLSNPFGQTITVPYGTANGTAGAPSDYTATSGTLTFAPGDTSRPITVEVRGDTLYEADETFFVRLGTPSIGTLGRSEGVGTIRNDDSPFRQIFEWGGPYDYTNRRFLTADVNGDGRDDLIVQRFEYGTGTVDYALSTGDGFGPFRNAIDWRGPYDFSVFGLQTADVNGDGRADLVVTLAGRSSAYAEYRLSTGDGFAPHQIIFEWGGGYDYTNRRYIMADVNGDGRDDLIVQRFEYGTGTVDYALSTGSGFGAFQNAIDWRGPYDFSVYSLQTADVNGDGRADLITTLAGRGFASAEYRLSTGAGFAPHQTIFEWRGHPYDYSNRRFLLADVDGDGRDDLIVTRAEYGRADAHYLLSTLFT